MWPCSVLLLLLAVPSFAVAKGAEEEESNPVSRSQVLQARIEAIEHDAESLTQSLESSEPSGCEKLKNFTGGGFTKLWCGGSGSNNMDCTASGLCGKTTVSKRLKPCVCGCITNNEGRVQFKKKLKPQYLAIQPAIEASETGKFCDANDAAWPFQEDWMGHWARYKDWVKHATLCECPMGQHAVCGVKYTDLVKQNDNIVRHHSQDPDMEPDNGMWMLSCEAPTVGGIALYAEKKATKDGALDQRMSNNKFIRKQTTNQVTEKKTNLQGDEYTVSSQGANQCPSRFDTTDSKEKQNICESTFKDDGNGRTCVCCTFVSFQRCEASPSSSKNGLIFQKGSNMQSQCCCGAVTETDIQIDGPAYPLCKNSV